MPSDSAMLNVNMTSSASGGSGTSIIASIASSSTGKPSPWTMSVISFCLLVRYRPSSSPCHLELVFVDVGHGRLGARLPGRQRFVQLVDVSEDLSDGRVQARRDLLADVSVL